MSSPVLTLTDAVVTVAAYSTAVQIGLLDRIDREPADAPELARTCGANERGIQLLLGTLESAGFVERLPDGRYRPTLAGLAGFHPIIPLWEHLPEAVRTGVPAGGGQDWSFWGGSVDAVAAALPPARRVLDVAAGDISWSIAYAARNPGCRVTAVDHPAARRSVSRNGLGDRFDFQTGVQPTPSYDLIMVPHRCGLLDEAGCAELFRKLAPALAPGGVLAVIETRPGGRGSAILELSLYLRTPAGAVHRPECYDRWLTEAGLTTVDTAELDTEIAVMVITGRRP